MEIYYQFFFPANREITRKADTRALNYITTLTPKQVEHFPLRTLYLYNKQFLDQIITHLLKSDKSEIAVDECATELLHKAQSAFVEFGEQKMVQSGGLEKWRSQAHCSEEGGNLKPAVLFHLAYYYRLLNDIWKLGFSSEDKEATLPSLDFAPVASLLLSSEIPQILPTPETPLIFRPCTKAGDKLHYMDPKDRMLLSPVLNDPQIIVRCFELLDVKDKIWDHVGEGEGQREALEEVLVMRRYWEGVRREKEEKEVKKGRESKTRGVWLNWRLKRLLRELEKVQKGLGKEF